MTSWKWPGPVCSTTQSFDTGTLALTMMPQPDPLCFSQLSISLARIPTRTSSKPQSKKRAPSKPIVKTDPNVWKSINSNFGTKIDFAKISIFEGGQRLVGYVPTFKKTGKAIGASGVTIATGFDIGQFNVFELESFQFGSDIDAHIMPYASLVKDMAISTLIQAKIKNGVGLVIDRSQANRIDKAVKNHFVKNTKTSWNNSKPPPFRKFEELTVAQQTVLFSRTFHQGIGMPKTRIAKKFYHAAQLGDWKNAETELRNYAVSEEWYKNRVKAEANLLTDETNGRAIP